MKIKISYERFGKIKVKAELSVSMDCVFVAFAANEQYRGGIEILTAVASRGHFKINFGHFWPV